MNMIYYPTMGNRKRVFIALKMSGIAGQEKLSGIFRQLGDDHDWDIALSRTAAEFTPERVAAAIADGTRGFIVSIPEATDALAALARKDIPTVAMDVPAESLAGRAVNLVRISNSSEEIGREAANHLLAIGKCRAYAYIHNSAIRRLSEERCNSFTATLRDHGCWCHVLESPDGIAKLERPLGVFAANDDCGYSAIEYCHAHRLRVPEDVAVLGSNNDTLICENCHPRLSSIQPDFEREGFLAAESLTKMMTKRARQLQSDVFVGVKTIVRRESTAEISPSGKLTQKALAYIRRNALKGISVDDVARYLQVSRRLADLRFRELQGTTIGETIIQVRLEEVKRLLRSTHDPIDAIAEACGYENPNYLKNLFRKRFAMTMRDFRGMA